MPDVDDAFDRDGMPDVDDAFELSPLDDSLGDASL
jgi:hypothetical protein